jgi:hypothetical protein
MLGNTHSPVDFGAHRDDPAAPDDRATDGHHHSRLARNDRFPPPDVGQRSGTLSDRAKLKPRLQSNQAKKITETKFW